MFDFEFFLSDPRKGPPFSKKPWKKKVWQAIEESSVFVGMTQLQVMLAIGSAKDKNSTITATGKHEQWVYPEGMYLYFDGDTLKTIQR